MDGILPLWKPKGMTSHDCVFKIRKLLKTKKVGHTGTLDPEVEGVLPICIGQATKIVPFLTNTKKTYIAEVSLGTATDTEDAYGQVVDQKPVSNPPDQKEIIEVLKSFEGVITQVPPMYSAVKVNGKKLYEYARANQKVERPERQVTIFEIKLIGRETNNSFKLKVTCSKGTYIRTLCVDIGARIGYPAHMSDLIRTETGSFSEKDTYTFDEIEQAIESEQQDNILLPIARGITQLDQLTVNEEIMRKVLNGQKLAKPDKRLSTDPFAVMYDNHVLAIYQTHPEKDDQIKPVRVFQVDKKKV
ncbi:tRNA pseudouridine(55) synthase TruB [Virgibacillus oceani]|uniref:tRNA pseudouridine synthase B n=1 Tax=Virgibacillus oceani TaxID=1479511 RepID=A0A917LZW7_9BACI|nr:tRNA pseudouridine(55) synthase TruB [Virgibacillus oceani]GGG68711.1 tRNA pseudouridine synthase B [Virgibacillus oceani]